MGDCVACELQLLHNYCIGKLLGVELEFCVRLEKKKSRSKQRMIHLHMIITVVIIERHASIAVVKLILYFLFFLFFYSLKLYLESVAKWKFCCRV